MFEDTEKTENEIESVKCPKCEERFRDLRGLTSHARHAHDLSREEIYGIIQTEKDEKDDFWKVIVGAGTFLLAVITMGRIK